MILLADLRLFNSLFVFICSAKNDIESSTRPGTQAKKENECSLYIATPEDKTLINASCTLQVIFMSASEEINRNPNEYWTLVMDIARRNSLARVRRCGTIMGRGEEEELSAAQIMYPCMQCADIFYLKVRFTLGDAAYISQCCTSFVPASHLPAYVQTHERGIKRTFQDMHDLRWQFRACLCRLNDFYSKFTNLEYREHFSNSHLKIRQCIACKNEAKHGLILTVPCNLMLEHGLSYGPDQKTLFHK